MTPPLGVPSLKDTGEHDAVEDATPDQLDAMANQPASKLFVVNTCAKCWVKRWVRGVRVKWALLIGAVLMAQAIGVFAVRAVTEQVVRKTVLEVLKEQRLISVADAPASHPMHFISQAHADEGRKAP